MVRKEFNPSLAERTLGWGILMFICFMVMFSGWKIGIIIDKYNRGVYNDVLPPTLMKKVERDDSI